MPADRLTLDQVVEWVADRVANGEATDILVTNANKAWLAARDEKLFVLLRNADLAVPEWAMVWAARRLGRPPLHHVGGITLMERLLAEAASRDWSVFCVGARPHVVERMAHNLRTRWPDLRLVGYHHGYATPGEEERLRSEMHGLRPDLLFVAMGSPRQEYWIESLRAGQVDVKVAMGVGGSFDVLAGVKRDAPRWARGRGLEWLYRLGQDPRRLWRRYLVTNAWFVGSVLQDRLQGGGKH